MFGKTRKPPDNCTSSGCNAPTRLVFAELKKPYSNQTVFPVGSTVEYVCQPGYAQHLGMSPAITCLRNRTWSGALEFCKRKQCANPGDPENGRAVVLTDLLFGSKVNYTCDKGYKLIGGSQRTCEISGTRVSWSGDAPVCQRIVCDPPPDIPHGRHSGQSMDTFSYADVVTYTCDAGHLLAGEPSIFCTTADGEHGVWSGPPPRCGGRALRCVGVRPHRRDSVVSSRKNDRGCGGGWIFKVFFLALSIFLICLSFSFAEVKCPPPPAIANGKHSGQPSDTHLPGTAVQYTCWDGYSLIGNASIMSLHTQGGLHVPSGASCSSLPATGCKRPEIENGRTTGLETVYRLADTIVFECNFGYALKGSQESQCQFGGTWDPPPMLCRFSLPVITCISPNIQNGEVAEGRSAAYRPGANVTFQCHPGYVLWGSRGAKCQPDGRWAPAVPTCEPVTPRAPSVLPAHAGRCCVRFGGIGNNLVALLKPVVSCKETVLGVLISEIADSCTLQPKDDTLYGGSAAV
uniref:Sushi domain-containing protein n=1 Tax=Aquila chrysaetos chrysaetos TaxID=223781 RepID=A0A663F9D4_AQUCH